MHAEASDAAVISTRTEKTVQVTLGIAGIRIIEKERNRYHSASLPDRNRASRQGEGEFSCPQTDVLDVERYYRACRYNTVAAVLAIVRILECERVRANASLTVGVGQTA